MPAICAEATPRNQQVTIFLLAQFRAAGAVFGAPKQICTMAKQSLR
jgi:hypothetical protein